MEDFVLDELLDFLQASDELTLPAALMLDNEKSEFESIDMAPIPNSPALAYIAPAPSRVSQTEVRTQRSKDAIRRSEYRKRQKAEKEALRQEINDLSAKLDKLQNSSGEEISSPTTDAALSTCLWRAIACRQNEHRRAAEDEQSYLRAAITSRAKLIEDLRGFLQKRAYEGTIANGDFGDAPPLQKRMRLEATDSALFETFLQELNTVYLQTDYAVSMCELAAGSDMPLITKHKDGAIESYQHAERQLMPFKFEPASRFIWQMAQLKHRQEDREIYEGVEDPENTMAIKFRITSRQMGEAVSLLQRVVIRRYQEKNRVVAVWRVFTEGEGLFRGMHSDETGWGVLRPSTTEAGICTGTIFDIYYRQVPMHFSHSLTCTPVVNEFTKLVINIGEEENQIVQQGLENMLLDDELEQEAKKNS
ncbi:uncharacterized protein PHALS_01122 [Plasmopara halstedii]|uniref:M96 mating-specific protein family n=1 Tax=Plasmopara halstedii TaxID=4781 RepID=A0A0P1AUQ6_PLAHL|nr:uncharacterized protein PHALS_01122 [Plasmopara halstedii]CEG44785.1 hypothetical protein PHALS_01122 [Plasmopara halstedii]|eukprot:XP_024581154.1 hypothetical protein PHALS_01122 [Plasmopara halstedii]